MHPGKQRPLLSDQQQLDMFTAAAMQACHQCTCLCFIWHLQSATSNSHQPFSSTEHVTQSTTGLSKRHSQALWAVVHPNPELLQES
jgi:hypothetical protein